MLTAYAMLLCAQVVNESAFSKFTCGQLVEKTIKGDGKAPFALAKRNSTDREPAIVKGLKSKNVPKNATCLLLLAMGTPVTKEGKACLEAFAKPVYDPIIRVYALQSLRRNSEAQRILQKMPKIQGPARG